MSMGIREKVDVCVVGAGHAGCEAALACACLLYTSDAADD